MLELLGTIVASPIAQAIAIFVVTAWLKNRLDPKGKLVWSVSHQHYYRIPRLDAEGSFSVRTQQVWFQNLGRKPIESVEIVFNWKPQHLEVWEPRQYEMSSTPDGRLVLSLPNLSSKEWFTVSMIDTFGDIPEVLSVRWKGGIGQNITMVPMQVHSKAVLLALWALILLGSTTIIFLILRAGIYAFNALSTAI
ncbi:hypothetical protein L7D45_09030 [Brucella pseudogrignonensis]|uniref:hypothetical protein n=1 Tax=Brucella pseudogrignonensis TaxID=419475 RepID=UPI001EDA1F3D|nr:hypothetical protein [Brucella pseudogrignonensis]UKK92053.1 hypothetical protein L7D45_09030 [Brucella pseudogrignonensis]